MSAPGTLDADAWRRRAREWATEQLQPLAERIDREDRLPVDLPGVLGEAGFMGLTIPTAHGGTSADTRSTVAVLEEISRASAAAATLLSVHLSVAAAPIVEWGTETQRQEYLPRMARGEWLGAFGLTEPSVGSDAANLATRYRREGSGFVLDGSKMFITNGGSAHVVLIFATKDPAEGHRGISAFLVRHNTPGFSVAQRLDKLGLRGSETTEIHLEDARLPSEGLLGQEGNGLRVALGALTGGRVGIAACALGVARAAFDEAQRSAQDAPADWKRAQIARAYVDLEAGAGLVERAATLKDLGQPYAEVASAAKLQCSRVAVEIASTAFNIAGPPAARSGARAGRLLRDARVFPIVEGTSEIQELILGRALVDR